MFGEEKLKLVLRFCQKCNHKTIQVAEDEYGGISGNKIGFADYYCPNCGTKWKPSANDTEVK